MTLLTTLAKIRRELNLGDDETADDDVLTDYAAQASFIIEADPPLGTGRKFSLTSATVAVDWLSPLAIQIPFHLDLYSLSSVVNGDGTPIALSQVILQPQSGPPYAWLKLKNGGSTFTYIDDPSQAIQITGQWGYSASVPHDITRAATLLAVWMYRSRSSRADMAQPVASEAGLILPAKLPSVIDDILSGYRRVF